ncbi:hypothetical protein NDU88_004632 [Pleurodeles waltl]|uniref:Integrin beta epidermal growth factor-like domain-containing protein n=1 Tax=Pleurodeles waltl TaxID=8319 RepID=A0AAV7NUA8_PLEWA|nr:hypothetical protein NDU88_004632 [Pleurodeles waltl]
MKAVILLVLPPVFLLLAGVPLSVSQPPRGAQVVPPAQCKLSRAAAEKRCRSPDGSQCSGRGTCDCGVCICEVTEPGKYYGPLCECHDWVCQTYDGEICGDKPNLKRKKTERRVAKEKSNVTIDPQPGPAGL